MQLSETVNVYPVTLSTYQGVDGPELSLEYACAGVSLDQQTAAEFLPILRHFIETGELPQ